MATYNGARFLKQQIDSIVMQLDQTDELVVVDDASTDDTWALLCDIQDQRIRLFRNDKNRGVASTFERAVSYATGDYIFLSDQDDVWKSTKILLVMQAFREDPKANVVVSDAAFIDECGLPLPGSYYAKRGKFRDSLLANLFRCKFLGCTMAFRAELLRNALPFPRSGYVLHDIWLGTVNRVSGGKTLFISAPLVLYRRHDFNVTGNHKLGFSRQLFSRGHLLKSAAVLWARERFGK